MNQIVHAKFNPFEARSFHFRVASGQCVAQIVASCGDDVPSWFWFEGEVRINGEPILRKQWASFVPVADDIITLHAVIEGGGGGKGGGGTKNTIITVAAIALLVGATLVSGGLLGPAAAGTIGTGLFGASFAAGGIGATLGGLALTVGAAALMMTLTPPPMPTAQAAEAEAGQEGKGAGISANTLRPLATLPAVLGKMRYSPPLLAPPYTTFDNNEITVHAIVGLAGEYDKATLDASLLINGVAIDEFDLATVQVRYGTPADVPLTICTDTVIEDRRGATLSNFVLGPKANTTLLAHQDDPDRDKPQWIYYKTAGEADEIRVRLLWPAGIGNITDITKQGHMPFRVEIRERGTSTWLRMPTFHFTDFKKGRQSLRKEIVLKFVDQFPGGAINSSTVDYEAFASYYRTAQGQSFEYISEAYFNNYPVPADNLPVMTGGTTSGVTITASNETAVRFAWHAADNSNATWWQTTSGVAYPHWWKVQYPSARIIKSFAIRGVIGVGNEVFGFGQWTFQGSNDNVNWDILGTYDADDDNITWNEDDVFWFQVASPGSYLYYRFHITRNAGNTASFIVNTPDIKLSLSDAQANRSDVGEDTDTNHDFPNHVDTTANGFIVYLHTGTFPKGEYELRIMRGLSADKANFNAVDYTQDGSVAEAMFFDYLLSGGTYEVTTAPEWGSQVAVEQFATIEHVYPFDASIHTKGVCMIGIEGTSVTIDSLSAIFHSIVPIYNSATDWTTSAASSNPAALRRHVLLGRENALALPGEILNEPQHIAFYDQCVADDHVFNAIVDGLSVAQVVQQIDAAGYALAVYSSAQWGVIFEHDRSLEAPVQVFTPLNTRGLTVSRDFAKLPHGFRVQFLDETSDWEIVSPEPIVYMDGFDQSNAERIETLELPGFTNQAKAEARALFDIRQIYLRNAKYILEIGIEGLIAERGDLIGLNHDVISRYHDFARVKQINVSGGNVTGLVMEATIDLGVAAGEVDTAMAAVLQLNDRSVRIKPVNEQAATDTISFVTPFALPAELVEGCVVGFGVVNTETKRCLVHTIEYIDLLTRRIVLVDEAPGLHV